MQGVYPSQHPLIQAKLTRMRDGNTPSSEFRRLLCDISSWLFFEASRDLPTKKIRVQTPLAKTTGRQLRRKTLLVPVLRAGLGMSNGLLDVVPDAEVGFIGLQRNEKTLSPESYYEKLPERISTYDVFLLDPMLATGGSSVVALDKLVEAGAKNICMISLVAAPEGIRTLRKKHKSLPIFCAAIDKCLNEVGFIVPGLGDAGDRLFGR